MHEIPMYGMSEAFFQCWQAAAQHLHRQVDGGIKSWLRCQPIAPFLEHLSFRLGNQLFFIRVDDVDGKVQGPGNENGFIAAAEMARGHALIMPMKKNSVTGAWAADAPGWGLLNPENGHPVNPVALITDEKIEMTPWEVQDFAVQIVRDYLEQQGFTLMSWQSNPAVNPSIWFVGESRRPEWVVVRVAKFPAKRAPRPANWAEIVASCSPTGSSLGHFASVVVASSEQSFLSDDEAPLPLWRGHALMVDFRRLEAPDAD